MKKPIRKKYVKYHSDGSMWAKGYVIDGKPDGYFEWFRKDGTIMRSGYFSIWLHRLDLIYAVAVRRTGVN